MSTQRVGNFSGR